MGWLVTSGMWSICTWRSIQVARQTNKTKRRIEYALASDLRIDLTLEKKHLSSRGRFLALSGLLPIAGIDDFEAGAPLVPPILDCATSASVSGEAIVEACEPKGCANKGLEGKTGDSDETHW
jgi:hypothetical protein